MMRHLIVNSLLTLMLSISIAQAAPAVRLAVLGDSDSHSYQDSIWFPADSQQCGGKYHAIAFQWTEVLAQLRPQQIDQGRWDVWGARGRIAKLLHHVGLTVRTPRKQDFEYNYAWSGARCDDLLDPVDGQAHQLLADIRSQPAQWRDSVVVIRIGINDLGVREAMDRFAREGDHGRSMQLVDHCVSQIEQTTRLIASMQPQIKVMLVGIFDNAYWLANIGRWRDHGERKNIEAVLDHYDNALRALAKNDSQIGFFDDRAFFIDHFHPQLENGEEYFDSVMLGPSSIGERFAIHYRQGDKPLNALLADGHAGTAYNALWAKALIDQINRDFALSLPSINQTEIIDLVVRLIDQTDKTDDKVRLSFVN